MDAQAEQNEIIAKEMNFAIICSIKKRQRIYGIRFKFPLRDVQSFKILCQHTLPHFLVLRILLSLCRGFSFLYTETVKSPATFLANSKFALPALYIL